MHTATKRKLNITCMPHQQLQRHEGLTLQILLPCTVPSWGYHKDEAVFETDLLQSICFPCMSENARICVT